MASLRVKSGNLLELLGYFTADVSPSHRTFRKTRWKTTWPENSGRGPGFTVYDSVYSTPYTQLRIFDAEHTGLNGKAKLATPL